MSWGGLADKIMSWFTPGQRIRRIKDEIDKLNKEKAQLLKGEANDKKALRLADIEFKLGELNGMLKNAAGTS